MVRRLCIFAILIFGPFQYRSTAADFPTALGIDATWGRFSEIGLGARLIVGLGGPRAWEAVGHFVYYLPAMKSDAEARYYEANVNLLRSIYLGEEGIRPYVGAGLNVARETETIEQQGERRRTFDETSAGLNLLAGMHFGAGMRGVFFESRAVVGRDPQLGIAAGIRF